MSVSPSEAQVYQARIQVLEKTLAELYAALAARAVVDDDNERASALNVRLTSALQRARDVLRGTP